MTLTDGVSIAIQADGKFRVKFVIPPHLKGQEKEDFLRKIGNTIVHVFDKDYLPRIAESFNSNDADSVFVSKFITLYLELLTITGKRNEDPDAPLVSPSAVFQYQ